MPVIRQFFFCRSGYKIIVGIAVAIVLGACRPPEPLQTSESGPGAGETGQTMETSAGSLDGLWLSRGYGYLIEIGGDSISFNEVTAISCLPYTDGLTKEAVEPDGSWRIRVGGDPSGAFFVPESDSVLRLLRAGTASDILFDRIETRPPSCTRTIPDTPAANFGVFWTSYREHYPFFEMKGVDWDAVRVSAQSKITAETTAEALFELLSEIIAPLQDMHTGIIAQPLERQFVGLRSDPYLEGSTSVVEARERLEQRFARALEVVESRYIEGELQSFCNGHLLFGKLPGGITYLWLDQEGDYTDSPEFAKQLETMEAALDSVFAASAAARGLILDTRKNFGGSDILSLALASRLTDKPYFAYAKVARSDPDDTAARTAPQVRKVQPGERPGYHGPVIQLTGPYTISAGETLTQALMGREPGILRVGEHTQGVFSDTLSRRLPNGWRFWLPNELFLTESGEFFDGPGIPPDVTVPVFREEDITAGRDPALEKAIGILRISDWVKG